MKIVKLDDLKTIDIKSSFENPVVIPTETVYGLAARIDNQKAVENIFKIKGRPSDNPLILHIADLSMLYDLIDEPISPEYSLLIDNFWPGPLTLIFKCKNTVPTTVLGSNSNTVAVRMPKNQNLRNLIKEIGVPLAAPSANTSGKPSPTTVDHVIDDLGEKVELYIDDGPCTVGLESTIFGILNGESIILRPGNITKEQIESILKKPVKVKAKIADDSKIICPGQKYKHYSPVHPVYLFVGKDWKNNMIDHIEKLANKKIGILKRKGLDYPCDFSLEYMLGERLDECIQRIFSGLRWLDKKCDVIFVVGFETNDQGLAIMDRLEKAASYIIN